ncbi:MAG: tyrosine-protein phosphatase [Dehalococcoidia bacterium]
MPNWVINGVLATSPRPGFTPGPEYRVPDDVTDRWISEARDFGIASIMCLLADDQLWLYRGNLLKWYQRAGFEVAHIATLDQQTHPFTQEQYDVAWQAFLDLPKPVLVHCSAGMDRTGRIVQHILARLQELD